MQVLFIVSEEKQLRFRIRVPSRACDVKLRHKVHSFICFEQQSRTAHSATNYFETNISKNISKEPTNHRYANHVLANDKDIHLPQMEVLDVNILVRLSLSLAPQQKTLLCSEVCQKMETWNPFEMKSFHRYPTYLWHQ